MVELNGLVGTSSKSHQLVSTEGEQPKHQMAHDFGMSLDYDAAAAELALEARVGPFGHAALTVTNRVGRLEVLLRAATRIVVDQGYMPNPPNLAAQHISTASDSWICAASDVQPEAWI